MRFRSCFLLLAHFFVVFSVFLIYFYCFLMISICLPTEPTDFMTLILKNPRKSAKRSSVQTKSNQLIIADDFCILELVTLASCGSGMNAITYGTCYIKRICVMAGGLGSPCSAIFINASHNSMYLVNSCI